ncbi:N-acetyltransferase family protein [Lysinibacillus sphaericus]
MNIEMANKSDLPDLLHIDQSVIGNNHRSVLIDRSIQDRCCLVCKIEGKPAGFLLSNKQFFDHWFVSLVIVHPDCRKRGIARGLFTAFEEMADENKIFSSANQSHNIMHRVFLSLGYEKSGLIENLDEGDPEIIYVKKRKEKYL